MIAIVATIVSGCRTLDYGCNDDIYIWLEDLRSANDHNSILAERAIYDCGTNCVPCYLSILDSGIESKNEHVIKDVGASPWRSGILIAFRMLGDEASPWLPNLWQIVLEKAEERDERSAIASVSQAMAGCGTNAVPWMIVMVNDINPDVRYAGMVGILDVAEWYPEYACEAEPFLDKALNDLDDEMRGLAKIYVQTCQQSNSSKGSHMKSEVKQQLSYSEKP
jgi:hypothetical protein